MNTNSLKKLNSDLPLSRNEKPEIEEKEDKVEKASESELFKRKIYTPSEGTLPDSKNMFLNDNKTSTINTNITSFKSEVKTIDIESKPDLSLFNNQKKEENGENKKEEKNENSLFKSHDQKSSIFNFSSNNIFDKDEKKDTGLLAGFEKKNSLFNNDNKGTSIFAGTSSLFDTSKKTFLFDSDNKDSQTPSIFGNANKSGLFGSNNKESFLNTKTEKNDEEDNEDNENEEEEPKENENAFQLKENKDIKNPYDIIIVKKLLNFKVDESGPFGNGTITIEKSKDNDKLFMVAFRNKTQKILHDSMLVPKISNSTFMKNKMDSIVLRTIKIQNESKEKAENEEKKAKVQYYILKMKFETEKDSEEFKSELDKIFKME
jgi:hypothetical protein